MFPRLILDLAAWSPGAKVGSPDSRALVPRSAALEYDVGVFDSGGIGFDSGVDRLEAWFDAGAKPLWCHQRSFRG